MSKTVHLFLLCLSSLSLSSEGLFPNVPQCEANDTHCVYVDPVSGHNDVDCLKTPSAKIVPCKNLSFAFNVSYQSSHTVYVLSNNTHELETVVKFHSLDDISFVGVDKCVTIIQCVAQYGGFTFKNASNLHFTNLTVSSCSSKQNSTSMGSEPHKTVLTSVALYFYQCENISMDYVSVQNSPKSTGVIVYDTVGENVFRDSEFSNNTVSYMDGGGAGGGFYVEFTYCIPGSTNCIDNKMSYTNKTSNSNYTFENCTFKKNIAQDNVSNSENTYLVPYRSNHIAFGRGGGLSVFFKGNATNNFFHIKNCTFKNNIATWGGGLFVEYHDDTYNNEVLIERCLIIDNHCLFTTMDGTAGGGMRLGLYVFGTHDNSNEIGLPNSIKIVDCRFYNNSAFNGGGLSISPTLQNVLKPLVAKVLISNSRFMYNTARLGAALHISKFAMIPDGYMIQVSLLDCTFTFNTNDIYNFLKDQEHEDSRFTHAYQPGLGAMYVNQVPVVFNGTNSFEHNNGSALVAVGSSLDFSSSTGQFTSNQGINGGAIALLGLAWIRIDDATLLNFAYNLATLDGGAIYNQYIEREDLVSYSNCFLRHSKYLLAPDVWKTKFSFLHNFDRNGNRISGIFSTSILPCTWNGSKSVHGVFCWNDYWKYTPPNCSAHTHSSVGEIKFTNQSNSVKAFPGRQFTIPIKLFDDLSQDLGHNNDNVFSVSFKGSSNNSAYVSKYIWKQETTVNGDVSNVLKTLFLDSVGDRAWHVVLEVELNHCPPGLIFDKKDSECVCKSGSYSGAVSCDSNSINPYLNNNTWMGTINTSVVSNHSYLTGLCPPQYCFSNESVPLTNDSCQLDRNICLSYHRTGILCGLCIENFSVAVNKPYYQCTNCTGENIVLNKIKYVAAVYIPLTLLFTLIIVFNIRLTSAPANAFIVFSQVVSSTFDLSADGQISYFRITGNIYANVFAQTYKFLYGIFNLEFIEQFLEPLCVGNLNSLESISLDYIVAFYPLLMIVLILISYKLWSCVFLPFCRFCHSQQCAVYCTRVNLSKPFLPAFAAFALLSYNKFSQTSSFLVSSQPLVSESGEAVSDIHGVRVYFAGYYSYYSSEYRTRFLFPACLVFGTFVAIPPLLLLDFPVKIFEKCLSKIGFLWRRYPVGKVHILLDTFQGCFKNKMRIFAGLYFLFRLAVNTSYNLTNSWLTQYLLQQFMCLVMVALLVICQPYNKENRIFNIIDPLIFLNLGALNIISFYLLSVSPSPQDTLDTSHNEKYIILQFGLLLLPLVYILLFLVWYFLTPHVKKLKMKILRHQSAKKQVNFKNTVTLQEVEVSEESDEDEALLKRAKSRNTYCALTSTLVDINSEGGDTLTQQDVSSDSGLRSTQTNSTRSN